MPYGGSLLSRAGLPIVDSYRPWSACDRTCAPASCAPCVCGRRSHGRSCSSSWASEESPPARADILRTAAQLVSRPGLGGHDDVADVASWGSPESRATPTGRAHMSRPWSPDDGTATSGVLVQALARLTASESEAYGGFEPVSVTQRAFIRGAVAGADSPREVRLWNHVAPRRRRHGKSVRA